MHCVYLTDIAAILSEHGPSILSRGEAVPPDAVTRYWVASRNRFELWHQAMSRYRIAEASGEYQLLRAWWGDYFGVLEEVLVSQMLTRVIASIAAELTRISPKKNSLPSRMRCISRSSRPPTECNN